jgi:hypothetical protein
MKSFAALMVVLLTAVPSCGVELPARAETPLVPLSEQVVGISTVATMLPGTDIAREVSAIASVGVNAIRVSVKWNLIEPDLGGPLRWGPVDAAVQAAREHSLRILMTLEGPAPRWAQDPSADPTANGNPPLKASDFGAFVDEVARRYSDATSSWEVWNEPNIPHYLDPPTVDTYLPLLREAFKSIRRSGSVAPVLTGGTSSNLAGTPDLDFIRGLYASGASGYFDGISVHPYTYPQQLSFTTGLGAIVTQVRQLMRDRGDDGKKIWITEFGQPTGDTPDSTSEEGQARILKDAIRQSRQVPWIGGFYIFNTVDLTLNSPDQNVTFGLFRYDYSPKPAVAEVRAVVGE